ncbi:MAG: nucleotidyltransferase family protein [Desulfobacterales bacterium]|nr:nucleotidyltransferase family protein [Desulfobacterales bacterium]
MAINTRILIDQDISEIQEKYAEDDDTFRPMSDIDILCKEGDVPGLQEQMLIKGYFQADNHDADNHFPNHFSNSGYYHTSLHEKIFARKQSHLPPFFIL